MINYLIGDASRPSVGCSNRIIAHIVNDIGRFGSGFAFCIAREYPTARSAYFRFVREVGRPMLGMVQLVTINPRYFQELYVANMFAQSGIRSPANKKPIRYTALTKCLVTLREHSIKLGATIHMPRIGAGLAGGDWEYIERLINDNIPDRMIYVYDLPSSR